MLKQAIQRVQRCWTKLNEKRDELYSVIATKPFNKLMLSKFCRMLDRVSLAYFKKQQVKPLTTYKHSQEDNSMGMLLDKQLP